MVTDPDKCHRIHRERARDTSQTTAVSLRSRNSQLLVVQLGLGHDQIRTHGLSRVDHIPLVGFQGFVLDRVRPAAVAAAGLLLVRLRQFQSDLHDQFCIQQPTESNGEHDDIIPGHRGHWVDCEHCLIYLRTDQP